MARLLSDAVGKLSADQQLSQFECWKAYAVFVHSITLSTATLTREKRLFLLTRAVDKPLVPALHTLLLSNEAAYDGDPGYGYYHANTPHAEHLTILLLSPELRRLVLSLSHLEHLNFKNVFRRAPKVTEIHIGLPTIDYDTMVPPFSPMSLDYMPGFPLQVEQKLGYIPAPQPHSIFSPTFGSSTRLDTLTPGLETLPFLTVITIDGASLRSISLRSLGQLATLESLTITDPLQFGLLGSEPDFNPPSTGMFPSLHDLTLKQADPFTALLFFKCEFLVNQLHQVRWDGDPLEYEFHHPAHGGDGPLYREALGELAKYARSLESLHLQCQFSLEPRNFWLHSEALDPISSMQHLSSLRISSFDHVSQFKCSPISVCTCTPSQLQELYIGKLAVPVEVLPLLAAAHPLLSKLHIELDAKEMQSLTTGSIIHTSALQPMVLFPRFKHTSWPVLKLAEELKARQNLVR